MQGPGPKFETYDCAGVFHKEDIYKLWVQAMAARLKLNWTTGNRVSVS